MPVTSFTGEITIVPYSFVPRLWFNCAGSQIAISQHSALYSIIGSIYGGDDSTYFMVPDMQLRIPMHSGQGPGLSFRMLGADLGLNKVPLTTAMLPGHDHKLEVVIDAEKTDDVENPASTLAVANDSSGATNPVYIDPANFSPSAQFPNFMITVTGENQEHENRQPTLTMRFIICADGIYPTRT